MSVVCVCVVKVTLFTIISIRRVVCRHCARCCVLVSMDIGRSWCCVYTAVANWQSFFVTLINLFVAFSIVSSRRRYKCGNTNQQTSVMFVYHWIKLFSCCLLAFFSLLMSSSLHKMVSIMLDMLLVSRIAGNIKSFFSFHFNFQKKGVEVIEIHKMNMNLGLFALKNWYKAIF